MCEVELCSLLFCVGVRWARRVICSRSMTCTEVIKKFSCTAGPRGVSLKMNREGYVCCIIRERCLHLVMNLNRPKCSPNGTSCCIAAINSSFDLKNASPLFFSPHWWWLTLQHTLQKSPLMHPRERERVEEKAKRGMRSLRTSNTQHPFMCPDVPTLFTQIPVLISIPCGSLQGGNAAGVSAPLHPWEHYAFIWANNSLIFNWGA